MELRLYFEVEDLLAAFKLRAASTLFQSLDTLRAFDLL